jgi:hypothetical protein
MIIPSAIFVLASYIGPEQLAASDVNPNLYQRSMQENNNKYNRVESNTRYEKPSGTYQERGMSEPERAEEGRMVVPPLFR